MRRVYGVVVVTMVVLSFILAIRATMPTVQTGTWAPAGQMSVARSGAVSLALPDGRVMVIGGADATGVPTALAEFFGTDGSWSAAPPMSMPRAGHAAIWLLNGEVLVTGGTTMSGGGPASTAEIFDPLTNKWTTLNSTMFAARSGHTMSQLGDGSVLIAGGRGLGGSVVNTLEILQIAPTEQFKLAGTLQTGRFGHAAAALQDGRVLIVGGSTLDDNGNPVTLSSTEIFDVSSGVTAGPALTPPRTGATATTLLDGTVLIAGGSYPEGAAQGAPTELKNTDIFNPADGSLTPASAQLKQARAGHQAFLLPHNANVLFVGGSYNGAATASVEQFTPWTGTIKETAMTAARADATGSGLNVENWYPANDGLLLIAGGKDASGTTQPSAELFRFAAVMTDKWDYAPGQTVKITGSGWQPGEVVDLTFREKPDIDTPGPFTVTADANGNFVDTEFAPDALDRNVRFFLTAVGATSGLQAQHTFTDTGVPAPTGVAIQHLPNYQMLISWTNNTGGNKFTAIDRLFNPAGGTCPAEDPNSDKPNSGYTRAGTASVKDGITSYTDTIPSAYQTPGNVVCYVLYVVNEGGDSKNSEVTPPIPTVVDNPPLANNDSYTVNANSSLTVTAPGVLGNDTDTDAGQALTAVLKTGVSHGSLTLNADGSFTYTPTTNYTGTDSFTYHAKDNLGTQSATPATVTITISAANQATLTLNAGSPLTYGSTETLTTSGGSGTGAVTYAVLSGGCSITPANSDQLKADSGSGTCSVQATKAADSPYSQATSAPVTVTLQRGTLTVTSNNKSMTYGGTIPAFDAAITGYVNGDTSSVVSGSPSCSINTATPNVADSPYTITCTQGTLSATNYTFSFANTGQLTVNKAPVTVAIQSDSPNISRTQTSIFGQAVTLTATVTSDAGTPTGTVDFTVYSTQLTFDANGVPTGTATVITTVAGVTLNGSGVATVGPVTGLPIGGPRSVEALYHPTSNFAGGYATLVHAVVQDPTTTSVVSSSSTSTYGDAVTFTATVTGQPPTSGPTGFSPSAPPSGTVSFYDAAVSGTCALPGGSQIGSAAAVSGSGASGTAAVTTSSLSGTPSQHNILACYSGDTNYAGSNGTTQQTVNKAKATVNVTPYHVTYDGTEHVATGTATGVGGVNLGASLNLAGTKHTNAGDYPGDAWTFSGGANYEDANGTVHDIIDKKNATWTTNPNSKTYGEADPVPLTNGSGTGFVAVDGVSATYSRAPGETVAGSPYHITATLDPAGVLGNYNITNAGADFTVNPKAVTVTPTSGQNKIYGSADPSAYTYTSAPALIGSDTFTGALTRDAGENVGFYNITQGTLALSTNYTLVFTTGIQFEIKPLGITASMTVDDKTYDGTTTAHSACSLTGVLTGDVGKVTCSAPTSFPSANASATAYTLTSTATLSGTAAGNYTITNNPISATAKIIAANTKTTVTSPSAVASIAFGGGNINFTATVVATNSTAVVNEGVVTFTVQQDSTPMGTTTGTVSGGSATGAFNVNSLNVGTYTVYASYSDAASTYVNFNPSSSSNWGTFRVIPYPVAGSTLTVTGTPTPAVSLQYSDNATLTLTVPNTGINGQVPILAGTTATFKIGTQQVGSAVAFSCANNSCVATTTVPLLESPNGNGQMAPGARVATAALVNLNPNFQLSSAPTGAFTIQQEDAEVTYTGLNYFSTISTQSVVNVPVSFTLQDATATGSGPIYDAAPGDITKTKTVTISLSGIYVDASGNSKNYSATSCQAVAVAAVPGQVGSNGLPSTATTGSCTFSQVPVNGNYTVTISPGSGSYYQFAAEGDTEVTIATGNDGSGFITGGGYQQSSYLTKLSGVKPAGVLSNIAAKLNFGYTAKYNKSGKNLQASVNIIVRAACSATKDAINALGVSYTPNSAGAICLYQIKSNKVISMIDNAYLSSCTLASNDCSPGYGVLVVGANVQDVTTDTPISILGNLTLQLTMYDNGEPNTNAMSDTLTLDLRDNSGNLWFSNSWTGTNTAIYNGPATNTSGLYKPVIQGGNLKVH